MTMTSEAKGALAKTIRALRERLLGDLFEHTKGVYLLPLRIGDANLDEATRAKRARLEAWVAEQLRAEGGADAGGKAGGNSGAEAKRTAEDFQREAVKQAAYTWLNRLVILRLMEAPGPGGNALREPAVVTGGWESRGYKHFRQLGPALARGDETEGYAFLLRLCFEDLRAELPGVFGPMGVAELIPMPPATLRHAVEALDQPELEGCWTDDMTLGWIYQYWNDPEREALDAKLNARGKLEPFEIASKTQMFTERYMVDWLLQNSLGPLWLAMCKKHGWAPEVEAGGTLARLEERRAEWRAKREAGEVSLTELMSLHTDAERRWAYYVPQPLPEDAVEKAPKTLRDLKLLDPAVGSGHFLVVALELLVALYQEEARHRGEAGLARWSKEAIVERILSHNLHGIDLDRRAVQIAAAALWLKARQLAPKAAPERLNLVASDLKLASLADDDPALVELRSQVQRETGLPGALTDTLVHALRGADHLGSLLKVDSAVDDALDQHEAELGRAKPEQGELFGGFAEKQARVPIERGEARAGLLGRLERFLAKHTAADDLGLRLRGEQLAAGVRFVRMVQEGSYDLVVANPPYLGTGKLSGKNKLEDQFPLAKMDYFAAFMLRGLQLVRPGGVTGFVTLSNWMFLKAFAELRKSLLSSHLVVLSEFGKAAFSTGGTLISTCASIFRASAGTGVTYALRTFEDYELRRDETQPLRTAASLLAQVGRHEFDPAALKVVPEWPLVYWWSESLVGSFARLPALGAVSTVRQGLATSNNARFLRSPWEVRLVTRRRWAPFVKGSQGRAWMEPLDSVIDWRSSGLAMKLFAETLYGSYSRTIKNEHCYFRPLVSFTTIGSRFAARAVQHPSAFDVRGSCVVGADAPTVTCLLNSKRAKEVLESLNPGVNFQVGDVARLPLVAVSGAESIFSLVEQAFAVHESHREPSVEFTRPGPSPWRHAQDWAQAAVDRPEGAPLPEYTEELDPEPPSDHLSFALGVALGRFGAKGEGILEPATADLSHALPAGILFLDTTLDSEDQRDSLGHPAAEPLHEAWRTHGAAIGTKRSLRDWLALDFFKDVHKGMYENRPIHWPLSSEKRTFVAWVSIHRMGEQTLRVLLADHLHPALNRIEGELTDLRTARDGADKQAARAAEKRYDKVLKARDELQTFIADVEQCADQGPVPTDKSCPAREQAARYAPDLDDGVMLNSAALWKLLDPQWKDPKKWWKELATANPKGNKDYDWSHLAMRYWPTRVDEKCQEDPSLGVAHGCFWRYHPARAWAWELRLQDEIGPEFRIEEAPYRPGGRDLGDSGDAPHRAAYLRDHAADALATVEKEALRRMRRGKERKSIPELRVLEPGLWSALADEVWAMELRLSEKQGVEFRLRSPDEAEARAAFEAAHPALVKEREARMKNLAPPPELFEEASGEDDEEPDLNDVDDGEEES